MYRLGDSLDIDADSAVAGAAAMRQQPCYAGQHQTTKLKGLENRLNSPVGKVGKLHVEQQKYKPFKRKTEVGSRKALPSWVDTPFRNLEYKKC